MTEQGCALEITWTERLAIYLKGSIMSRITPYLCIMVMGVLWLLSAQTGLASCGSETCPIDYSVGNLFTPHSFHFNVSYQRIAQDQPRIGRRIAAVGELPNPEHDEIATLNEIWNFQADYNITSRLRAEALVPFVHRTHRHLSHESSPSEVEAWDLHGIGDVMATADYAALTPRHSRGSTLTIGFGLKFPTGQTHRSNEDGDEAEITLQPGSGSFDLLSRAHYMYTWQARTIGGSHVIAPIFVTVTHRLNGRGREEYRIGQELQVHAGASYPITSWFDLRTQVNARMRAHDDRGRTHEPTEFTGGTWIYLSPGGEVRLHERIGFYTYVQLPIYQRVNRIQLTSSMNWLAGFVYRFSVVRH